MAVTRPVMRGEPLRAHFLREGARVFSTPTIRFAPPTDIGRLLRSARDREGYDALLFTSATTVRCFAAAAAATGGPLLGQEEALPPVAAIGPATARALAAVGVEPALVPSRFVAESFLEALEERVGIPGRRFLLPRAMEARELLPDGIRKRGGVVDVVEAYRTLPDERGAAALAALLARGALDLVVFTSGSTVRSLGPRDPEHPLGARVAVIGPVTARVARELGYAVAVVPERYTAEGLVEAVVAYYGKGRSERSEEA